MLASTYDDSDRSMDSMRVEVARGITNEEMRIHARK